MQKNRAGFQTCIGLGYKMLSVIIPTRNRKGFLEDAVKSILRQILYVDEVELLVVDNDSTDGTRELIQRMASENPCIRYLFAQEPGLHVGRHLGMREAKGNILAYTDDDIIATEGWLAAIKTVFESKPKVALVGGKVLPRWEGNIPEWINLFRTENKYGWRLGYLSLLDLGEKTKEIPAGHVFGCNFSVRKNVLLDCGGFHPDGMPQELIRYRGDGETALSLEIQKKGYIAIYEPKASVYHRIPEERLTIDYFCKRAFNQGVSDSFTEIRKNGFTASSDKGALGGSAILPILVIRRAIAALFRHDASYDPVESVRNAYEEGRRYHRKEVESDPELLKYVMKESYI